jgi:hypothetical protein
MESKIPLPTDNIYKFYALFGILLLITFIAAFTYVHQTTNALLFDTNIAVWELEEKGTLSQSEAKKMELLKRRMEIADQDRKAYNKAIGYLIGVALTTIICGFYKWHKVVQPKQDRLLDLQIQKAELELVQLQKEQNGSP